MNAIMDISAGLEMLFWFLGAVGLLVVLVILLLVVLSRANESPLDDLDKPDSWGV